MINYNLPSCKLYRKVGMSNHLNAFGSKKSKRAYTW